MFSKKSQLALALVCVLGTGALLTGTQEPQAADAPTTAKAAAPAVEVTVITTKASDVAMESLLSGRTNAYREAEVRPQVSGILMKRLFEEGAEVKEGQPLYQIDDATYKAALETAKAQLAEAQATLVQARADAKRSAELVKIKAVSEQSNDAAQAAKKTAEAAVLSGKAAVRTAQINLDYTKVRSPISGRISRSEVTEGALMQAYTGLMTTVHQLDPIYVDVTQTSEDLMRIRREIANGTLKTNPDGSARVQLILSDGTTYEHEGKLTFTDAAVSESMGTVNLRAVFPNPERFLMPGMYVRAKLSEGVRPNSIQVDQQCVMRDNLGHAYVYVVTKDNKVEQRMVETLRTIGTSWVIGSGLSEGEKVIFEGMQRVRVGATVTPKELDRSKMTPTRALF